MTSSYPGATKGPTKSHLITIKYAAVTLITPESLTRILGVLCQELAQRPNIFVITPKQL